MQTEVARESGASHVHEDKESHMSNPHRIGGAEKERRKHKRESQLTKTEQLELLQLREEKYIAHRFGRGIYMPPYASSGSYTVYADVGR